MIDKNKFGSYVKKMGNKYYPTGRPVIHSKDLWQEKTWEARRDQNGSCYFKFMNSNHGGGTIVYELTSEEFEAVKAGDLLYEDLIALTDYNSDRQPVAP